MLGADQALLIEAGVDRAHRVRVDPGELGEVAHARQAGAGAQVARGDQGLELPGELGREREVIVPVDAEIEGRRWLIHATSLPAARVLVKGHTGLDLVAESWLDGQTVLVC